MIQWPQLDQTTFGDHFIALEEKNKVSSVCLVPSAEVVFAISSIFLKKFSFYLPILSHRVIVNTET